jgi:putative transposase
MKQSKFSEEQIIAILREAEKSEQTISAVCRAHSISENTFYKWRQKYGGIEVSEARRLRELEKENARLKRLLAERDIEIDAMKEVIAKKW